MKKVVDHEEKICYLTTDTMHQARNQEFLTFSIFTSRSGQTLLAGPSHQLCQVQKILNDTSMIQLDRLFAISCTALKGMSKLCALQMGQDVELFDRCK